MFYLNGSNQHLFSITRCQSQLKNSKYIFVIHHNQSIVILIYLQYTDLYCELNLELYNCITKQFFHGITKTSL